MDNTGKLQGTFGKVAVSQTKNIVTEALKSDTHFGDTSQNSIKNTTIESKKNNDSLSCPEMDNNTELDLDQLIYEDYNDIADVNGSPNKCNDDSDKRERKSSIESDDDIFGDDIVILDSFDEPNLMDDEDDSSDIIELAPSRQTIPIHDIEGSSNFKRATLGTAKDENASDHGTTKDTLRSAAILETDANKKRKLTNDGASSKLNVKDEKLVNTNIMKSTQQKISADIYAKVFIVGNPTYNPYLQNFSYNEKIILKLNSCLTIDNVKKTFKCFEERNHPRSLWLLFFGIECIGRLKYRNMCERSLCKSPLYKINLNNAVQQTDQESRISSMTRSLKSLQDHLRSVVGPGSDVIIMPIAPIDVDVKNVAHDELHKSSTPPFYIEYNQIFSLIRALTCFHKNSSQILHWQKRTGFDGLLSLYNCNFFINDLESVNIKKYIDCTDTFVKSSLSELSIQPQTSVTVVHEHPSSESEEIISSANEASLSLKLGRFDHVLFVGTDELAVMRGFKYNKNISFLPSRFPISWEPVKNAIIKLENDNKSIFVVIVYDICTLATKVELPKSDFHYYVFGLVTPEAAEKVLLTNVEMLYKNCVNYCNTTSNVFVAPLFPRYFARWPKSPSVQNEIMSKSKFNNEHSSAYVDCRDSLPFDKYDLFQKMFFQLFDHVLGGNNNTFSSAMMSPVYRRHGEEDIKVVHMWRKYVQKAIQYYGNETDLDHIKLFDTIFSKTVEAAEKSNKSKELDGRKRKLDEGAVDDKAMPAAKRRAIAPTKSVTLATLNRSSCPNFLHNVISQSELDEKLASGKLMYDNAYIIVSPHIIQKISPIKRNLPVTFVPHQFSDNLEESVNILQKKMTPFKKNSICFILFDLTYFAICNRNKKYCSRYQCRKSLSVLNAIDKSDGIYQNFILDRIQMANHFIQRFDSTLTCFPLPLPPHIISCDFQKINHAKVHELAKNSYIAIQNKGFWNIYCNFVGNEWEKQLCKFFRGHDVMYDLYKFLMSVRNHFYRTVNNPSRLTDQNDAWIMYEDVITQLLLSMRIQEPNAEVEIGDQICQFKVWNLSDSVSRKFVIEIISKLKPDCEISSKNDGSLSVLLPLKIAKLLAMKLNNRRIAHTKVKAECAYHKHVEVTFDYNDCQQIDVEFAKKVANWKEIFSQEINKASSTSGVNLAEFKTQPCGGQCKNKNSCPFSHGQWEQRRNPFIYKYQDTMCSLVDVGCPSGLKCSYSHNIHELKFHPAMYQTKACSEQEIGKCSKPFCEFYHKGTPEILFTHEWENQLLFGLSNTVKYFAEAVKNLRKLKCCNLDFTKIILISPSLDFLDDLKSTFEPSFGSYQKTCSLVNEDCLLSKVNYDILFGTPEMFSKVAPRIGKKLSNLSLIIIDDFKAMVEDTLESQNLFVFLKHLKNFVNFCDVGVVVIVENFSHKIPHVASGFLNKTFNIVPPPGKILPTANVGVKRRKLGMEQDPPFDNRKVQDPPCATRMEKHDSLDNRKEQIPPFDNRNEQVSTSDNRRQQDSTIDSRGQQDSTIDSRGQQDSTFDTRRQQHSTIDSRRQQHSTIDNRREKRSSFETKRKIPSTFETKTEIPSSFETRRKQDTINANRRGKRSTFDTRKEKRSSFDTGREQASTIDTSRDKRSTSNTRREQHYTIATRRDQHDDRRQKRSNFDDREEDFNFGTRIGEATFDARGKDDFNYGTRMEDDFNFGTRSENESTFDARRQEYFNFGTRREDDFNFGTRSENESTFDARRKHDFTFGASREESTFDTRRKQDFTFDTGKQGPTFNTGRGQGLLFDTRREPNMTGRCFQKKGDKQLQSQKVPSIPTPGRVSMWDADSKQNQLQFAEAQKRSTSYLQQIPDLRSMSESGNTFFRSTPSTNPRSRLEDSSNSGQSSRRRSPNNTNKFATNQQRSIEERHAPRTSMGDDLAEVHYALATLENFSRNVKYLGFDLDQIVATAMNLEPNISAMLDYLSKNHNTALIKNTVHEIAKSRVSQTLKPIYENIFEQSSILLKAIGGHSKPRINLPLPDVGKIAKATLNKDSVCILEVVRTTLAYHGHNSPTKELINKLFLEVCALHFEMSMDRK